MMIILGSVGFLLVLIKYFFARCYGWGAAY